MAPALALALLCAGLDPVEVAERHERSGRPHLALHLLDALTRNGGDVAAQDVRARLEARVKRLSVKARPPSGGPGAPPSSVPSSAPGPGAASPGASRSPAARDPLPLYRAAKYMDAAPLFRARLEASPHDYPTFTYLVMCYFKESERRLNAGDADGARKAYQEGRRTEQMYRPNFPEQTQSQAPDGLVREFGP